MRKIIMIAKYFAIAYVIFGVVSIFVPILPVIFGLDGFFHIYSYSTKNGEFQYVETVGKDNLDDLDRQFKNYLERDKIEDTTLYRDFKINYLKIWRWPEYYVRVKKFKPLK